ncbi:MAG TPA: cation transporter [Bacteroidales bacterium]|nr:cation transporter [Bacteroidales bacterium]HQB22328.1 cation transporter [Bacteroidales bacterium]
MKKTILILTMMFLAIAVVNAQEQNAQKAGKTDSKISEVVLSCKMDCGNCAEKVKKQLSYTKGVTAVEANHETDLVVVKYRNDKTDVDKLIASLGEIKYQASVYKPKDVQSKDAKHTGCPKANTGCPGAKAAGCAGVKTSTGGSGIKTTTDCPSAKTHVKEQQVTKEVEKK